MTFLIIILFVIAVLLLSNLAMKTTRVLVDNQYGRASAAVRINLEDEHYFFSDRPLENQLQMYRDILTQTGRYTVWPRLINFDDHWRTHESENTLPNRSLWFTVKTHQGREAREGVHVRHSRTKESKKELPLLVQVNFKNERNETTLRLKDIHESDEGDVQHEDIEGDGAIPPRQQENNAVEKHDERNERTEMTPMTPEEKDGTTSENIMQADAIAPKLYDSPDVPDERNERTEMTPMTPEEKNGTTIENIMHAPTLYDSPDERNERTTETTLENMQADAIAPKLYDSPDERKFARTSKRLAAQLRTQSEATDETERVTLTQKKRIFYFFHGGATFAGSPHKYNNLHWLKTIAWLSERNGLLTDVVSIDYRLQPENNMDESILDCVETLSRTLRLYRDSVEEVHLVGFSAGCLLTLQTVLLIEQSQNVELESLFGIDLDNVWLQQLNKDWSKVPNRRVHLLAPLVRLDRLFINDGFDCSSLLETFTKSVFEPNGARKYDVLYWIVRLHSTLPTVEKLFIIDVCRNSLSNHAISLYMTLRHLGRNDTEGPLATDLTIFDESSFFVDAQLVDKIRKFELTRGLKPNKYTRDAIETSPKNSDAPKILNMLHYHFFPYIVLCEASWLTMTSLLTWAPVKNNSKQLKRDQLELLNNAAAPNAEP